MNIYLEVLSDMYLTCWSAGITAYFCKIELLNSGFLALVLVLAIWPMLSLVAIMRTGYPPFLGRIKTVCCWG
jgi:hypothetical protein